jgi:hypothetical protein
MIVIAKDETTDDGGRPEDKRSKHSAVKKPNDGSRARLVWWPCVEFGGCQRESPKKQVVGGFLSDSVMAFKGECERKSATNVDARRKGGKFWRIDWRAIGFSAAQLPNAGVDRPGTSGASAGE